MVSSSVSARFLYGFPYRFQGAWTVLCSMKHPLDVVRVGAWNSLVCAPKLVCDSMCMKYQWVFPICGSPNKWPWGVKCDARWLIDVCQTRDPEGHVFDIFALCVSKLRYSCRYVKVKVKVIKSPSLQWQMTKKLNPKRWTHCFNFIVLLVTRVQCKIIYTQPAWDQMIATHCTNHWEI